MFNTSKIKFMLIRTNRTLARLKLKDVNFKICCNTSQERVSEWKLLGVTVDMISIQMNMYLHEITAKNTYSCLSIPKKLKR